MVFIYTVAYYYRIAFHWTHFTWKLSDRLLIVGVNSMTDLIVNKHAFTANVKAIREMTTVEDILLKEIRD